MLALDPVGYWPLDEGEGQTLHDLSVTQNPGKAVHVEWDNDVALLNFKGAYQWLEIPPNPAYLTPEFSLGGWVFIRSSVVGSGWPNRQGFLFLGNEDWQNLAGIQLCVRRQELLEIMSDGAPDVLGTRLWVSERDGQLIRRGEGKPQLPLGRWHHVIYTFRPHPSDAGTPSLQDLALGAKVTASNDGGHLSRAPSNATDGLPETEWIFWPGAEPQTGEPAWMQLDFDEPVEANRVRLIGRAVESDQFLSGKLEFSDGSEIEVGDISQGWDARFSNRTVRWVRFTATSTRGPRPGLSAFQIYNQPPNVLAEEGVVINTVSDSRVFGTGSLYWNGVLIASQDDIPYRPVNRKLLAGNDAFWWHQQAGKSGSLDGSLRDLVWFNRALDASEVARLHKATQPEQSPPTFAPDALVVDTFDYKDERLAGRVVGWQDWDKLSLLEKRELLSHLATKDLSYFQAHVEPLKGLVDLGLKDPKTLLPAVQLLVALNRKGFLLEQNEQAAQFAAESLDNRENTKEARAESALALAYLKATSALPVVIQTLKQNLVEDGPAFPRVEDFLRNALILALLQTDPNGEAASLLQQSIFLPLLSLVDLAPARVQEIDELFEAGNGSQAIQLLRETLRENPVPFFTKRKEGHAGNYIGTATDGTSTYKVGTGLAWQGVEAISPEDFRNVVKGLASSQPKVQTWREATFPHLYRVPISKTSSDGTTQTVFLEGEDFIIDGHDEKVRGWSIFVDDAGYIHVMGGQHNSPNPDYFIPGSWERMGLSTNPASPDFPSQMYWVSKAPRSIEEFEFVGKRGDPRAVPADYLNYLVFLQNPQRETLLYGRADAAGFQSWGMYRYNSQHRRWSTVGDDPFEITKALQTENPAWLALCQSSIRGLLPVAAGSGKVLAWAWQPAFYNFCRDDWGARFDLSGRLHLHMQIAGLTREGFNRLSGVSAWSDDMGQTFHRMDGSPVRLPLTVNPAADFNADLAADNQRLIWTTWISLLESLGFDAPQPSASNFHSLPQFTESK